MRDRAFLVCVFIFGFCAVSMQLVARAMGIHLVKLPISLNKPLEELDEAKLAPYKVLSKRKIENQDVVDELGTEDYIQWFIEDPCAVVNGSLPYINLFITYYDKPDYVPHVPEVCYTGGGSVVQARENSEITVMLDGEQRLIPIRIIQFVGLGYGGGRGDSTVVYFFSTNGKYVSTRNTARRTMRYPFDKYAYFSKVEMTFGGSPSQEIVKASVQRFVEVLLPVLEEGHWPAWPPEE